MDDARKKYDDANRKLDEAKKKTTEKSAAAIAHEKKAENDLRLKRLEAEKKL